MSRQRLAKPASMVDRIAQALAEADGEAVDADPGRYRRLALASLEPLMVPTEVTIDAAHEAVQFDAAWARRWCTWRLEVEMAPAPNCYAKTR